ncbi:hypothetical protein Tco_1107392 [Tanacetum coccineum]
MVSPAVDEIAEQMVVPAVEGVAEPVVRVEEEQMCLVRRESGRLWIDSGAGVVSRVGSADFYPERRDGYRIDSAGSGLAGRCAAERHADPAAADYCYRDEQQGEHADAMHFGIGETDCNLREKTIRTLVVIFIFPFDF